MDPIYLGHVMPWPLSWAPVGWAICNGQQMLITQFGALYSLLGMNYGGDGQTYFNLPNFQGTVLAGTGKRPMCFNNYEVNNVITGTMNVALQSTQTGLHSHQSVWDLSGVTINASIMASTSQATLSSVSGNLSTAVPAAGATSDPSVPANIYGPIPTTPVALTNSAIQFELAVNYASSTGISVQPNTGAGITPHNNMQPYIALNYIIAIEGLYPPFN